MQQEAGEFISQGVFNIYKNLKKARGLARVGRGLLACRPTNRPVNPLLPFAPPSRGVSLLPGLFNLRTGVPLKIWRKNVIIFPGHGMAADGTDGQVIIQAGNPPLLGLAV